MAALEVIELLAALLRGGYPQRLLLVVVKVGRVPGSLALGDKGGLHLEKKTLLVTQASSAAVKKVSPLKKLRERKKKSKKINNQVGEWVT